MLLIKGQYVFYRFAVSAFYGLKALNICKYALDKKMKQRSVRKVAGRGIARNKKTLPL